MMKEPVYFLELELENVRCFGRDAMLDLSDDKGKWKRWTVILGDNGTGKTTLLQCLAGLEQKVEMPIKKNQEPFTTSKAPNQWDFTIQRSNNIDSSVTGILNRSYKNEQGNEIDTVGFKEITADQGYIHSFNTPSTKFSELKVFGYGANRFIKSYSKGASSFEIKDDDNSETLFDDDAKLINAEEWLLNMDYAASRESDLKAFAEQRKILIIEVLLELLPDINDIRFTTPTKEKLTPSIEFQTEYGYWVSIHQLSLGYKTMVAWMVDLAARMFKRYPESDNPLKEPAIVLVDEIDLHLHPKWQRKIFDYLSDIFPKTQFIVTAHSPLIVQSAPKDANIVVLRKEGDHVIIDNDIKSVHNWRLDQILSSDLFGGIPVRNDDVEEILKRRNELLAKSFISEAEKKELEALNAEADKLPLAENQVDIESKEIIRKAAEYFKHQGVH